jgi:hypothetical protein
MGAVMATPKVQLLSFEVQRALLTAAQRKSKLKGGASVAARKRALPSSITRAAAGSADVKAALELQTRDASKRLAANIRRQQIRHGLVDTRLALSSWLDRVGDLGGNGFDLDVIVENDVPYVAVMHPKGRKGQRFVRINLPPVTEQVAKQLANSRGELAAAIVSGEIGAAIAGALSGGD